MDAAVAGLDEPELTAGEHVRRALHALGEACCRYVWGGVGVECKAAFHER
jgi:hypothetical protein